MEADAEEVDSEPREEDDDVDECEHGGDTEFVELFAPFAVEDGE